MKYLSMIVVSVVALVLVGCANSEPIAGVIQHPQTDEITVGMTAPDIPFKSSTGKQTTLGKVRNGIAIVAFTEAPDNDCCGLNPELVKLGHRFRSDSVTVAQISLPTAKCPHGHGCVETCKLSKTSLVALCDTDRIAWKAYRQPKANTAFLLDERGKVIDIRPLSDLRPIRVKAAELSQELAKVYEEMYEGG